MANDINSANPPYKFYVLKKPTINPSPKSEAAKVQTQELVNLSQRGQFLQKENPLLGTAFTIYTHGGTKENLEPVVNNPNLSESINSQIREIQEVLAELEQTYPEIAINLRDANLEPQFEASQEFSPEYTSIPVQSTPQGLSIHQDFFPQGISDQLKQEASSRIQGFVEKAGGKAKDLVTSGGKQAAKTATKTAAATGAKAAASTGAKKVASTGIKALITKGGLTAALSTVAPGIGTLIGLAVDLGLKLVSKVIKPIVKWVREHPEDAAIAGAIGFGALAGSPIIFGGALMVGAILHIGAIVLFFAAPIIAIITSVVLMITVIVFIIYIINTGAYIVPPGGFTPAGSIVESQYTRVEKIPSPPGPFENDTEITVTYTITVTAKLGSLENVSFTYECSVFSEESKTCPDPVNVTAGYSGSSAIPFASVEESAPTSVISPTTPYVITYQVTYPAGEYNDSLISDTLTVSATIAGVSDQSRGSASIIIGDPPDDCPSIWPTASGYVTQGPDGNYSHSAIEAIDIGTSGAPLPVLATHGGVVRTEDSSCEGTVINIESVCGGISFYSRYSHLGSRSVSDGQIVRVNQEIGTVNNTGTCTGGTHLHYEFRGGLRMEAPWIPQSIPVRTCTTTSTCDVSW